MEVWIYLSVVASGNFFLLPLSKFPFMVRDLFVCHRLWMGSCCGKLDVMYMHLPTVTCLYNCTFRNKSCNPSRVWKESCRCPNNAFKGLSNTVSWGIFNLFCHTNCRGTHFSLDLKQILWLKTLCSSNTITKQFLWLKLAAVLWSFLLLSQPHPSLKSPSGLCSWPQVHGVSL